MASENEKMASDLKVSLKEVDTLKAWLASARKSRDELNERLNNEIGELKRVKNRETVGGQKNTSSHIYTYIIIAIRNVCCSC